MSNADAPFAPGDLTQDAAIERNLTTLLFAVCAVAFGVIMLVSLPHLSDPLIRFDDFPAYFGDEALFYEKTLSEGRWINYWWISRSFIWSPTTNFVVYQLAWAIFAGAAAINALGKDARFSYLALLATIIVLSPQAFLISGWFNTLMVGGWLIALYAVLSLYVTARTQRWMFLVFAPISMMSFSTHPLMLISLCLTRHDARRSLVDLVGQILLLALGIGLGMLLMYTLNYYAHGHFGIAIAEWREPTPATSMASLMANAERLLPQFMGRLFISSAYGIVAVGVLNVVLLVLALGLLLRSRPWLAVYIFAGLSVSVALMALHGLKEGVEIPMRALISVWVLFAIAVVKALADNEAERFRNGVTVGLILLNSVFAGQILKHSGLFVEWQNESRAIAQQMPAEAEAIFVYGDVKQIPGIDDAYIYHPTGLTERIRLFTGIPAYPCDMVDDYVCQGEPPFELGAPSTRMRIEMVGPHAVVQLPDRTASPSDNGIGADGS